MSLKEREKPKAQSCFIGWGRGRGQRECAWWEGHRLLLGKACALELLTPGFVSGTILYDGGAMLDNVQLVFTALSTAPHHAAYGTCRSALCLLHRFLLCEGENCFWGFFVPLTRRAIAGTQ